jgi:hypothetical protein
MIRWLADAEKHSVIVSEPQNCGDSIIFFVRWYFHQGHLYQPLEKLLLVNFSKGITSFENLQMERLPYENLCLSMHGF